jgi:DNA-binding NarL/FixJ family response regulator
MTVRVLIVDDASYVRTLVSDLITQHDAGWSVAAQAADGQQAIDVAPAVNPNLVLLDLSMPVMDGLQALPELRKQIPAATIVILTGFPSDVAQQAAQRAGADGYLEKDALVASLIPRLEAILTEMHDHTTAH